jgi:exopolyphosphatase/guanosine-5'-triphosphate,3'-diphosphate pyrophosphatase
LKLGAIDIGSNAIRLKVVNVIEEPEHADFYIKKLEYIRFPLRLGHDVFQHGKISARTAEKFISLMRSYKNFIDLYECEDYYAVATSAFREAENGDEIAKKVQKDCDLNIHIIDGEQEANYLSKAISPFLNEDIHLHIDVGGGSTELNLYKDKQRIKAASFKLGSVRLLEHRENPEIWNRMEKWIQQHVVTPYGKAIAIGTGGNINKLYEISDDNGKNSLSIETMRQTQEMVNSYSPEERIFQLRLNPDRADVIIPASTIYLTVMEWAHADRIIVPQVGLMDGIITALYEKIKEPSFS